MFQPIRFSVRPIPMTELATKVAIVFPDPAIKAEREGLGSGDREQR
jgi:hypothetical protein